MNADRICKVKMCGLFRTEDIDYVNEIKPDYIGFVFWEKSKRRVTKEQAAALKEKLDPTIKAVGVFVDEDNEVILKLLAENIIDIAQLHGMESEDDVRYIKEESAKPVIRMVKLSEHTDYDALNEMEADYLLFDSGRGCGKVFDWNLLKQVQEKCRKPFFLAGGIGPENAKEAVMQVKPYAIDLSSGLETNGVKDLAKMRALMEQLNANSESYAK